MDRILVVLGACGIHVCIGSVYAWSVLTNHIVERTGWSLSAVTFAFSLAILFLGTSAGFLGNRVQKWGAKKSALISAMFFTSGLIGSSVAIATESLPLLYLFYGVIGGIGLGIGYIAPVATLLKWFPKAKGFAGGCAVMSFGFAALLAGPLMQKLVAEFGLEQNFLILAMIYGIAMCISAFMLKPAPKNVENEGEKAVEISAANSFSTHDAVRTWQFLALWIVFFINISCGIALLSIASPMAQKLGMTAAEAAGMVGMIGILNGGGRIFFASISDYIGRGLTYITFFVVETIAFFLLSGTDNIHLFQSLVFIIVACYGGGFSCMPAYLADLFGTKYLSAIHGRILTAWGIAGICGPLMLTCIYEAFGSYEPALQVFSMMFILSTIIAVLLFKKGIGHEQN